jgi:hypothetical protein
VVNSKLWLQTQIATGAAGSIEIAKAAAEGCFRSVSHDPHKGISRPLGRVV